MSYVDGDRSIRQALEEALIEAGAAKGRPLLRDIPNGITGEIPEDNRINEQLRIDLAWAFDNREVSGCKVLEQLLRNALPYLKASRHEAVRVCVRAFCAREQMALPAELVSSAPAPMRHPLCGREKQVTALKANKDPRLVLIHGGPAMGQRTLALRCAIYSQELLDAETACFVNLEGDDLGRQALCFRALARALDMNDDDFNEQDPARAPIDKIVHLAATTRLALVHGPIREGEGGIDVLAGYHARLAARLDEERVADRVRVVQAVMCAERSWFRRLLPGPASDLVGRAPFNKPGATLVLPALDRVEKAEILDFAVSVLRYEQSRANSLLKQVSDAGNDDQLYANLAVELDERKDAPRPPLWRTP